MVVTASNRKKKRFGSSLNPQTEFGDLMWKRGIYVILWKVTFLYLVQLPIRDFQNLFFLDL